MLTWYLRASLKLIRKFIMINIGIQILADKKRGAFGMDRVWDLQLRTTRLILNPKVKNY